MMLGLSRNDPPEERAIEWATWFPEDSSQTWSGMPVSVDSSLQLLAVHGAVRMISESISTMPVDTFRTQPDGERVEVTSPHWVDRPASDLSWISFVSQILTGLLLDGNAYIQPTFSSTGEVRELVPVSTSRVNVLTEGRKKRILVDGKVSRTVIHIPGMMLPGSLVGLSPIEYARQTIGLGLSAMEFGAGYFDRDGNMPGVIELPRIAQPATKTQMASQWKKMRSRSGKGLPGIIDDGGSWRPTGVTSEQAQFLQTRKYSAGEICGQLFLLDPTDLGIPLEGSSISYANLDQRNVRRVQVTFMPHIVRLEKAFSELLPRKQYFKFNVDSVLRGDTKSRYDAYKVAIEQGFLTVDEVRVLEEMQPLTDEQKAEQQPPAPEPEVAPDAAE